ncbi:MAG: YhcH/YjgK/YiaL family protein [Treponema sp.]|jgi:YhcH/YjgK/YiaL family protein|nr:YhcH/YjgK/YiaL family protein [Treponema sp.]
MLILTTLEQCGRFPEERMARAFQFLQETDLLSLTSGTTVPIEGDDVFAQVQSYTTLDAGLARFETHDRHYDLHYMLEGCEYFYCTKRSGLIPETGYDQEKDITFYRDPPHDGRILLIHGDMVLVAPDDAHKPRCTVESPVIVKKIVIKVTA